MSTQNTPNNEAAGQAAILSGLLMLNNKQDDVRQEPLYGCLTLILDPLDQLASVLEKSEEDNESEVLLLENLVERAKGEIKKLTDALEEQAGGRIDVVFRNRPNLHKGFDRHDIVGFEVQEEAQGGRHAKEV